MYGRIYEGKCMVGFRKGSVRRKDLGKGNVRKALGREE